MTEPAWITKAKALRQTGLSWETIARELDIKVAKVRYAADPQYRLNNKNRVRKQRELPALAAPVDRFRKKAPVDTMAACRLFAAGKIDRSKLSQMLRGEV